jgi:hypothetical protein
MDIQFSRVDSHSFHGSPLWNHLVIDGVPPFSSELEVEPFLHYEGQSIYNPITDKRLTVEEPIFASLLAVMRDPFSIKELSEIDRESLQNEKWIITVSSDPSYRFRLKYVQIETNTICNHSCHFCPVSHARRSSYFMPTDVFERIIDQLVPFRGTLDGIWLHHYNEPTTDRRLGSFVRYVWEKGLIPCINSNASGLTPHKVSELMDAGGLGSLTINLSTTDRKKYHADRGVDHLELVLKNLDYLKEIPLAPQMHIVVIGNGDEAEEREFQQILTLFKGSYFKIFHHAHNNRGGRIQTGSSGDITEGPLGGCDFKGSRPLQHLTIDAYANVVLCCQDYHSDYVTGNLVKELLLDILEGDRMRKLRRWVYGLDIADSDFICRKCPFSLPSKASSPMA